MRVDGDQRRVDGGRVVVDGGRRWSGGGRWWSTVVVACLAMTDSRRGVDGAALPLRGSVSGHEGCVDDALLSVLGGSEVNDRRSFDPRRAAPLRARRDSGSSAPFIAASFRQ